MNEQACMASHVHPFFFFTCFYINPDYRKKIKCRKTTRKMCGIRREKFIKQQQQPRSHARHSNDVYSFSNVCFLPFIQTLWRYYFTVKLFLAQLFYSSKGVDSQLLLALECRHPRRVKKSFLWQIIMQIVAAVAFQSLILYPLLSLSLFFSLRHRKSPHCCEKKFMTFRGAI